MDWTVTYRSQDGKLANLVMEAADRATLFEQLKNKRITAIRIEQGKHKGSKIAKSSNASLVWGLLFVLVIVCVIASVILILRGEVGTTNAKIKQRSAISSVEPSLRQNDNLASDASNNDANARNGLNDTSNLCSEIALTLPEIKERDENALVVSNAFHSGAEQVMAWIFSCELGSPPPPLPIVNIRNEQHLYDILFTKLEEAENDSERTKEAKRSVEEAKKELCEYIKQGGEVQDFLKYYREQLLQAHHEYCDARKMIMDAYKDGESREFAEELTAKINERLEAKGIKPVELPEAFIQHYAGDEEQ